MRYLENSLHIIIRLTRYFFPKETRNRNHNFNISLFQTSMNALLIRTLAKTDTVSTLTVLSIAAVMLASNSLKTRNLAMVCSTCTKVYSI